MGPGADARIVGADGWPTHTRVPAAWCAAINGRSAGVSVIVELCAPSLVPSHMTGGIQVASISLGWTSVFNSEGRLVGKSTVLARFGLCLEACSSLFVQRLRNRGWSTLLADAAYLDDSSKGALAYGHCVSDLDFARRLRRITVHLHAVSRNLVCGKRTGFVEAGSPQPLVNANAFHTFSTDDRYCG